jgi:hypothetical protein
MFSDTIILILVSIFAATATFYVNVELKQGPIKSSALLSLVVALFFYFFPHSLSSFLVTKIPVLFFGASFAGMSSKDVIHNYRWMIVVGFIFGLIFINTSKFFTGYGGGLGTTALISTVITFSIIQLWQGFQNRLVMEKS